MEMLMYKKYFQGGKRHFSTETSKFCFIYENRYMRGENVQYFGVLRRSLVNFEGISIRKTEIQI